MKYVFLTNDETLVDKYTGTYVEVISDEPKADTVKVRFFDDLVRDVERTDLYDPDKVPFKVGDRGLIPGSRKSSGEGNGNLLQHS